MNIVGRTFTQLYSDIRSQVEKDADDELTSSKTVQSKGSSGSVLVLR
jgi:hypothetical protein